VCTDSNVATIDGKVQNDKMLILVTNFKSKSKYIESLIVIFKLMISLMNTHSH
jgi:hypothetical protein